MSHASSATAAWAAGVVLSVASALVQLTGCATPVAAGQFETRAVGSGQPVVVFQSGLGDGHGVWAEVQQQLADRATTVAFSRPGYGRSPANSDERSPCAVASEQREMLRHAGLAPPYLLVGHSLGGLYQYAYARLYPDEVAGIVLLDPTHPRHWTRLQEEAPAMALFIRAARWSPAFTSTMRREFDDQQRCLDEFESKPMPAAAARVLVRGRFVPPESGDFERMVKGLWADWPRLVGGPAVVPVGGAGHYIQRDRPDVVVQVVRSVLEAARQMPVNRPPLAIAPP
jgi:pimeloyl-ACP methyl ester carboxylesterase